MGERGVRRRLRRRAELAHPRSARAARARGRAQCGRRRRSRSRRGACSVSSEFFSTSRRTTPSAEPTEAPRRLRSTRRATVRIIPRWRFASTISRICLRPRIASPRPSRSIAARWRSARRAIGRRSSPCGSRSQQSRALLQDHEPSRRGRAADAPRARDRRKELRSGSSAMWRSASTISRQLLQDTNRLAEAEPLIRRALAIDEKSYGPDHPNVAIRLNNLAELLQDTNRLAEAEPLMRRALAIDEAATARIIPSGDRASTISRFCCGHRTASPRPSR